MAVTSAGSSGVPGPGERTTWVKGASCSTVTWSCSTTVGRTPVTEATIDQLAELLANRPRLALPALVLGIAGALLVFGLAVA